MKEPKKVLETGTLVKTVSAIALQPNGFRIHPEHIEARRSNCKGKILGPVDNHSGHVYFVKHEKTGGVAAYGWWEFDIWSEDDRKERALSR